MIKSTPTSQSQRDKYTFPKKINGQNSFMPTHHQIQQQLDCYGLNLLITIRHRATSSQVSPCIPNIKNATHIQKTSSITLHPQSPRNFSSKHPIPKCYRCQICPRQSREWTTSSIDNPTTDTNRQEI